jgi:hypothetical protein
MTVDTVHAFWIAPGVRQPPTHKTAPGAVRATVAVPSKRWRPCVRRGLYLPLPDGFPSGYVPRRVTRAIGGGTGPTRGAYRPTSQLEPHAEAARPRSQTRPTAGTRSSRAPGVSPRQGLGTRECEICLCHSHF